MPDVTAMEVDDEMSLSKALKEAVQFPTLMAVDVPHEEQPALPSSVPRAYQEEILREAMKKNVIAVLPTGAGKTLIGALLIKKMVEKLALECQDKKLAVFLVPSVPLVYQQSDFIRQETKLNVKNFSGEMGVDFWARDQWLRELELGITDVIVCTPQIFYNCLAHAYLCMEECSLLIIDECHHARKKHPLNTTLMHFYHSIGRGQPRPKILGLTASPIWNPVNPLKSLEVLESNLQASIIAVKGNMDELERYSYRPTEVVEMYQDNNYLEPGELYRDLSAIGFAGTDEARWDKIFVKSQVALEVLGPIGMNQFLIQLYRQPLEMMVRSASYTTNLSPDELQGIQRAKDLVDNSYENLPASIPVNDLPNKVSKLVQILTQYRQSSLDSGTDDTGFQCIIFVVQRHIAYGLAWMLERIEPLRKWLKIQTLVGHGTRKSLEGQSQDLKQQQETVKDFREGKYNVLISTAVGQEGLDFSGCDLVIRFDPMQTMIGYVQSRGRARHQKSKFVLMLNENSTAEIVNYQRFLKSEPVLNRVYREDRGEVSAYDMDNAQISAYDQALRETFTVEETGAVLTYEGAVPLVEQTCSLLPHAMGIPPPRPTYEELETMADGNPCYFISNIRLPPAVGIPTLLFHGTPRTSKSEAKRAVAFEAAKALRKYKLLNEYLLPHREKKGDEAEDGNGRHVGEDLAFEVDVHVRPTWGDIYAKGARLYLHPISVNGNTSVGIVAAREILVNTEIFHLWYGRDQDEHEVPVRTYPGRPIVMPAGYTRARLHDALARYSHNMMTRCIRPNYQMEGRLACLFAPLDPTGCLDVATLEQLADGLTRKVDGPSDSRFLAFDSMGRQIQIEKVRQNLKPSSRPIEVEQPSGEMVCREAGFSSYDDYALKKLTYMTGTSTLLESEDECMLQVFFLRRRRNNLVSQYQAIQADGIHGRTKGHPQGQRFIVPRKLIRVSNIPLETRDAYMLLPSIMRYITDYDRLRIGTSGLDVGEVELSRLHEALSPPAANYGHDYQRLETLGDRVLQLATTVYLYQEYPHKHEGLLSPLRANSVCNRFLRNKAHAAGLGSIMCMEPVMIARWDPPYWKEIDEENGMVLRTVKRKWMQDCLEALLGAAYLTGGFPLAIKIGLQVGLCFGSTEPWQNRPNAMPEVTDQRTGRDLAELEQRLGYSFNYPQLLLSSVTHPSYCALEISPYQRLEFLGDAVLDFVIMRQLFVAFPKADSGTLSWLKAVFVCNASLAYLSIRILELHKYLLHASSALSKTIITNVEEMQQIDLDKMMEEIWDYHPPKLFADIFEAICGAIFIDCGYDVEIVSEVLGPILSPFFASLRYAQRIDPIAKLIRWAVRVYKCQQIRYVKADPVEGEPSARQWISVVVHGEVICTAGADHAYTAKCKGSQTALPLLRTDSRMKDICDCYPEDLDIEDDGIGGLDSVDDENLMREELERVFDV